MIGWFLAEENSRAAGLRDGARLGVHADLGDRARLGDHPSPTHGNSTRTVPVTWSPSEHRPVTATVTTEPSTSDT